VLVAGVLYLNPSRGSLAIQQERSLVAEAGLVAQLIEARLPLTASVSAVPGMAPEALLDGLSVIGMPFAPDLHIYDAAGALVASSLAAERMPDDGTAGSGIAHRPTLITDFLDSFWTLLAFLLSPDGPDVPQAAVDAQVRGLVTPALAGETRVGTRADGSGATVFAVATPIRQGDRIVGVLAASSLSAEIDALVRQEREQVLQMFVIATLVSIGLSLVLASTIANPLSDLAAAAEIGRERNSRKVAPGRVRIPDLTARPDEIGRLSGALRGMVTALYDRIDANEQFAADVAHEIKNPLASLRSAIGSLRFVQRPEQRDKLLDVIEHDVRRLDRLVSDISNASRLDSELVKEEEQAFNLLKMITNISEVLGEDARLKGVEFITDLPPDPIVIIGLESRLAQVFVNLLANAISFCEDGDAIRVWARKRENRVLVVVEDTGPGIPEQALTKIFNRFYSERPAGQFGNNSGLGLAISKQIIEAHGGVIWAENIRPTDADITSDPLGARFVVGLPV
jgi:two-component system, OmpR family, sensor histidine kinase ChvG